MSPSRRPPTLLTQPSYLASQVSKYGRRLIENALAERNLALVHYAALTALDELGPLSQQELAAALDFDKSHLVAHIDLLEERGLVKRVRDPGDRRRNQLHITNAGQVLVAELHPVGARSQEGLLDVLTPDEQAMLVSLLRRVLESNDAARASR
ncbi:MarR family winged helix-turn-helix transcriptional regulator [Phytoactinopolyspora limicola]|uniref:MarR family winged helix-turn-helix transcriptional regulator n=1 Tax=Phytoactinopolyspora limicola TaxID=2715536 RepID=UPI0014082603|nr:MarR family transcriptional regulator [Phytoactinopolyspora limicola]